MPDIVDCRCQPTSAIRLVAAEGHDIFREGLRHMLASQPWFVVAAAAASGDEALELVSRHSPDVLLLDMTIRNGSALDVLERLAVAQPRTRTVLLSERADADGIVDAVRRGARGLVLKSADPALLYKCVRCVAAGQYWFGRDDMPKMIDALRHPAAQARVPVDTLTRRELEVVVAVADGATNRVIAEQLGLSDQTVKNHLSHIYDKVGVSSRLELALYAIHHKLAERPR